MIIIVQKRAFVRIYIFYAVWFITFIHHAVCLTTGPQPLPKPVLHTVPFNTSCFIFQYPPVRSRSSNSCLHLLPPLPVTYILPLISPSITCFRRQFLSCRNLQFWCTNTCFYILFVQQTLWVVSSADVPGSYLFRSAYFVIPDGCIVLILFFFDVLVFVYLFCLFSMQRHLINN